MPTDLPDDDLIPALRDSIRRTLERAYPFEARSQAWRSPQGFSSDQWAQFAELGWLGIGLPEDLGGLGGLPEQAVLAEELGRALVVEPWLANCGLAGPLLAEAAAPDRFDQRDLVAQMARGQTRLALAAWERQGRYDAFDVATTAERIAGSDGRSEGTHWRLSGRKTGVLGGGSAQHWLVLARSSGAPRDRAGLSLFVLPANTPGAQVHALPTYDGRHTADLVLDGVQLPDSARAGAVGQAWPLVARASDRATGLLCAESVGAMDRCLNTTRDYLGTRKQFGQRIIENQVVKHRLVDRFVAIEQARAITEAATRVFDGDAALRERAVSLAKAFVGPAGRRVGEDAVQLHGAIGMTEEYEVGQACKRLAAAANQLGDAHWHGTRLLARGNTLADQTTPG